MDGNTLVMGLMLSGFMSWPVPSYLLFSVLLLIFGIRNRFYHPAAVSEAEDIGTGRRLLAFVALLILLVSFTPVPISFSGM